MRFNSSRSNMCSAMHLPHKSEACCKGDGDSEGRDIKYEVTGSRQLAHLPLLRKWQDLWHVRNGNMLMEGIVK